MTITEKLKHYRLSQTELDLITQRLGRSPQGVEWALFSALWSEHCSYKSSKVHLRKFSYRNASTRDDSEENAGVVDIGYGEKIIFKMESHNHPSFIEPFQGAATGVGGILRDIFTMGARPIALADFLCFGDLSIPRMKYLSQEVVHGISAYGNCVGVPTVTGYTEYHSSYNENILVNAMAVGLLEGDQVLASSLAQGVGNLVVYVGAKTGKDGVHGAAMASESFDTDIETRKPNIQIGDPFMEKLLIESCLEILKENLVIAMQDMGAAGLTSSSFEMAAKGKVGMDLHLDRVPLRDNSMTPEEILLSESQERMLLVCESSQFPRIKEIFGMWDLDAAVVGQITDSKKVKLFWKAEVLTEIDPSLIVDSAPRYERNYEVPKSTKKSDVLSSRIGSLDASDMLAQLKNAELFSDKKWIYQQYDQRVGTRTVKDASSSLAVIRLQSQRDLAISVGCRPAFMRLDTRVGAIDCIAYPALQQAIKGFKPLAITDCLNFASPENSSVMGDFVLSCDIFAELSRLMDAPIISGNVSFYNETQGRRITPTPAIGMIGIKEDVGSIPKCQFDELGLEVFLLQWPGVKSFAATAESLGQSPMFSGDLNMLSLSSLVTELREFVHTVKPQVSRVVGQGGLVMTLEKMSLGGFKLELPPSKEHLFNQIQFLYEERLYDFIFAVEKSKSTQFQARLEQFCLNGIGLRHHHLGVTVKKSE